MFSNLIMIIFAFSGGMVVGSAAAAFVTLLDIVPRLAQLSKTYNYISYYEKALIIATVSFTLLDFLKITFDASKFLLIPLGIVFGIFVGLLASALAEVINVIPVLSRRANLKEYVYIGLIAIALGKIVGSLLHWLILVNF